MGLSPSGSRQSPCAGTSSCVGVANDDTTARPVRSATGSFSLVNLGGAAVTIDAGRLAGKRRYSDPSRPYSSAAFRASAWSVGLAGVVAAGGSGRAGVSARCSASAAGTGRPCARPGPPRRLRASRSYERRAYRGSAHGRHRVGGCMEPGPGHSGHQDAGLGVSPGLLARALAGMPAIWRQQAA